MAILIEAAAAVDVPHPQATPPASSKSELIYAA